MLRLIAPAVLLLLTAGARAQELGIAAFYGSWEGNAVSESAISANFGLTPRDIGVELRPTADGFSLGWNTVQRQRGDPANPTEELKATTLSFRLVRPGVWAGVDNREPLAAVAPYAWARIEGQTLIVNVLEIDEAGRPELQVYRRGLSGGFMTLEFTRIVEGRQVRTASGRLIKVAE